MADPSVTTASLLARLWRASVTVESLVSREDAVLMLGEIVAAQRLESCVRTVKAPPLYRWGDVLGIPTHDPNELLNAKQLASALGVPKSTVHRWTSDKTIPCYKLGHKTVRYRLGDVLAAAEQTTAAAEERSHGRTQARSPLARSIPIHRPPDREVVAIPPYDWSRDDEA